MAGWKIERKNNHETNQDFAKQGQVFLVADLASCCSKMSVFYQEDPPNHSKRCKFLASVLKDVFSNCKTCNGQLSTNAPEEDYQTSEFDDEQEVVVSEIQTRAMEKLRRKHSLMNDSFSRVFSPRTRELYMKADNQKEKEDDEQEREEYLSVEDCFSCCPSALSKEDYFSVKTNFSCCASLSGLDFQDFRTIEFQDFWRSVIQEMCYCEGWPFGLCKKAVLLPPLPKSPSESWSWRKGTRIAKTPYI